MQVIQIQGCGVTAGIDMACPGSPCYQACFAGRKALQARIKSVDVSREEARMSYSRRPAAQYLRMSTERQQYSLANQAGAIARYAADNDFTIVKTYSDPARSGLRLKNRPGLKQLLKDVVAGDVSFHAVLVHDVSRWGRFQDSDEAAHYEYLCKSSGVPVYYCAETFANDNSMATLIMKALKRGMAGEYSRELSVKVRAGLARLTRMGYKAGGDSGYGLRRLLLDASGRKKQLLKKGERKSLATDRVILVPGPSDETRTVQRIFYEFVRECRSLSAIARRLNHDGVPYVNGGRWTASDILRMLRNDHYAGRQAWGKSRSFLGEQVRSVPYDEWVICDKAFEPIVSPELFEMASARFADFAHKLSDEQLLDKLRALWRAKGELSAGVINQSRECPCATTFRTRFGGLLPAYKRIGYPAPKFTSGVTYREFSLAIRNRVVVALLDQSNGQLHMVRPNQRFRPLMQERKSGSLVSVIIAKQRSMSEDEKSWFCPNKKAVGAYTLLALLNTTNDAVERIYVLPKLEGTRLSVVTYSRVLRSGVELKCARDLASVVAKLHASNPDSKKIIM